MEIYFAEVALTRDDLHKHIAFPFVLPRDMSKMTVKYRYSPKRYGGKDAYSLALAAFRDAYPEGVEPEEKEILDELPLNNHVTLSLEREGALLGTAHRHSDNAEYFVSRTAASPGFTPTEVRGGEWAVVLSTHAILDEVITATIEVTAE